MLEIIAFLRRHYIYFGAYGMSLILAWFCILYLWLKILNSRKLLMEDAVVKPYSTSAKSHIDRNLIAFVVVLAVFFLCPISAIVFQNAFERFYGNVFYLIPTIILTAYTFVDMWHRFDTKREHIILCAGLFFITAANLNNTLSVG